MPFFYFSFFFVYFFVVIFYTWSLFNQANVYPVKSRQLLLVNSDFSTGPLAESRDSRVHVRPALTISFELYFIILLILFYISLFFTWKLIAEYLMRQEKKRIVYILDTYFFILFVMFKF